VGGPILVIKMGAEVIEHNLDEVILDIKNNIVGNGYRVVIVHGGGDIVSRYSRMMGIEPVFVMSPSGIRSRYTSKEELEVYIMVMAGLINKMIVAKAINMGLKAIGLSGVDGGIVEAIRKRRIIIVDERGRKRVIDGGYTGKITSVNPSIILNLLDEGFTLVISPIAMGDEGVPLNVDGDSMAKAIASSIKAHALIFLTDVEGVVVNGRVVGNLSSSNAEDLASSIGPGMNRKLLAAASAVKEGVGKAIICSGLSRNPISTALKGKGTVIEDS